MQTLHISDNRSCRVTLLPDSFIEEIMPRSNGDFVKIYIYLLSMQHHPDRELSLSSIADVFSCTEKDVIRAITYWVKEGFLALETDGKGAYTGLGFTDPSEDASAPVSRTASPPKAETEPPAKEETPVSISLSADRIRTLKEENAEVEQFLYVAETYLGRPLNRSDITCLLYFYDTLHMSIDLLEYLLEYCVMHKKTSIHYIQKVGLEWHKAGITTVKEAKENSSAIRKEYFTILNALGITGRQPVPAEIAFMDRWMSEYGFELSLILEACKKTVTNTGGSSFPYTEGILANWKKQNIRTLKDVQAEDDRHQASRKKKGQADKDAGKHPAPNRFHNFHQRDYDYDELEKELLKQQW